MEAVLHEIGRNCDRDRPLCATVEIPHYLLHVGLGADPTFVMVQVEPFDGEYYLSVGDAGATDSVGFGGCGNWTPFHRRNFVPFAEAMRAVREFVRDQRRTENIRWENGEGMPA